MGQFAQLERPKYKCILFFTSCYSTLLQVLSISHYSALYHKHNMDSYEAGILPTPVIADKFANPVAYQSLRSRQKSKRIHSMKSMYCSLSVCSILVALIGLIYLLFDPIVKYVILGRLVLRNESDFAELWKKPPITPHFKVYFFNLTNAEEFFKGNAIPHLEEVGPYTYHQKWIKENVTWHSNGTMSYSTRKEFKFMRELSFSDQSTTNITTINVPLLSAYYQTRKMDYYLKAWGLDNVLESFKDMNAWVTRTPEELIWDTLSLYLILPKHTCLKTRPHQWTILDFLQRFVISKKKSYLMTLFYLVYKDGV